MTLSSLRSSAVYASAACSNGTSCVASSFTGSSVIRRIAACRRRAMSHRPASRAGIVETWVLRIVSRRRAAMRLLTELPVKLLATHELPFEQAADGYAALDRGDEGVMHVALRF